MSLGNVSALPFSKDIVHCSWTIHIYIEMAAPKLDHYCNSGSDVFNAQLCYHFFAMAVNPELLKILVCPLCKTPVTLTENGQGLKCSQCRRVYPIRDDIPVMLISEAKVED